MLTQRHTYLMNYTRNEGTHDAFDSSQLHKVIELGPVLGDVDIELAGEIKKGEVDVGVLGCVDLRDLHVKTWPVHSEDFIVRDM